MTGVARSRFAHEIIGAVLRWVVLFVGPIALIVVFLGTWISYLLVLLLLGVGLGELKVRIHDYRARPPHHRGAAL